MLINGTPSRHGTYVVQVDGRVFRKSSNVPLTSEQKMIDQLITTMDKGKKFAYVYCVKEDVNDNDPEKYKWWKKSDFLKKFDFLTRYSLNLQLKNHGGIFIDGTHYKKSPMYYTPKY